MAFSVSVNEQGSCSIIILKDVDINCFAEIYSFGAVLNKFSTPLQDKNINVVDGFESLEDAKENIASGFKSTKLSPFVCRLTKGEYTFNNTVYKIDKFYMGDSAIHGLLFDQSFTVKNKVADEEKASVTLSYLYNKGDEGFPFEFEIEITYTLALNSSLTLTTKVINVGNSDMPLSDGWHPYFMLGSKVDELFVQFDSKRMIEFNDALVPTGNYLLYDNFNEIKQFSDTFLDNCFELNETSFVACSLQNKTTGLQLNIIPSKAYPYLQIYTPPHRNSIAIENLSSVPDAFNNGIGLIIAKPGSEHLFETTYQLMHI